MLLKRIFLIDKDQYSIDCVMSSYREESFQIMSGAEAFTIQKGRTGCLLCHGFTGTPDEMREIGEFLAERNVSVIAPRLPGHGTTVEDMMTKNADDWYKEYQNAYYQLEEICDEIFICGLSMGGVLTLKHAMARKVSGIITLATPVRTRGVEMDLVQMLNPFIKRLTLKKSKKELEDQKRSNIIAYERYPLGAVASLVKIIKETRKNLDKITDPILIIQGSLDEKWIAESAKIIFNSISSKDKELIYLKKTPHNIPKGPEKDLVKKHIFEFIKKKSKIIK